MAPRFPNRTTSSATTAGFSTANTESREQAGFAKNEGVTRLPQNRDEPPPRLALGPFWPEPAGENESRDQHGRTGLSDGLAHADAQKTHKRLVVAISRCRLFLRPLGGIAAPPDQLPHLPRAAISSSSQPGPSVASGRVGSSRETLAQRVGRPDNFACRPIRQACDRSLCSRALQAWETIWVHSGAGVREVPAPS
jgi:hypothetical protein